MAKIRTVKPELFRHEALFEAEQQYSLPLRLAFIGLFSCCDREGRFRWEPRALKLDILPYDEINFGEVLHALWVAGFIKKYEWQGKYYGLIPTWHQHQSINKHEPASKLPSPDQSSGESPIEKVELSSLPSDYSLLINNLSDVHMQASARHDAASVMQMPASLEVEVEVEVEVEREVEMERKVPTKTEVKKKQDGGANPNIVAQARRRRANTVSILAVFDHWKAAMQHPNAVLDKKRTSLIRAALQQGYTVDQLCEAVSGCAKTPHNLGHNERNQRYDGLHIILRDADQIERFIRNCHNPPQSLTPADQLLRANTSVGANWLKHKNSPGDSRYGKSR